MPNSTESVKRELMRHFLASLAYRTQKALRGSAADFADFRAAPGVRTPMELVRHMASVIGYARTFCIGGEYTAEPLPTMADEVERLHANIEELADLLTSGAELKDITCERMLQGPLADAMTHAGQLAMLRRLAGSPVMPENFIRADVRPDRLGTDQSEPIAPGRRDGKWDPRGEGFQRPGSD